MVPSNIFDPNYVSDVLDLSSKVSHDIIPNLFEAAKSLEVVAMNDITSCTFVAAPNTESLKPPIDRSTSKDGTHYN